MANKMKWSNLQHNKCPRCSGPISQEPNGKGSKCAECDYFITEQRLNEMKVKMGDRRYLDSITNRDNQEALNNL